MPGNTKDRPDATRADSDPLLTFRSLILADEVRAELDARTEARRRLLHAQLDEMARRPADNARDAMIRAPRAPKAPRAPDPAAQGASTRQPAGAVGRYALPGPRGHQAVDGACPGGVPGGEMRLPTEPTVTTGRVVVDVPGRLLAGLGRLRGAIKADHHYRFEGADGSAVTGYGSELVELIDRIRSAHRRPRPG